MSIVGIIVNPRAGKDIRRLVSAAGHTSDAHKIGIARRAVIGAIECGAERVIVPDDSSGIGRRAVERVAGPIELVEAPSTGSGADTILLVEQMREAGAGALVVLGGDGTNRDVAKGWSDAPIVSLSTGTNNAFPISVEATIAGSAAGLVAAGVVDLDDVTDRCTPIRIEIETDGTIRHDLALVELALIDTVFVGARAVRDPATIRSVIAAIAGPASTGLSSIPGRVHPVDRFAPGGVMVTLGRCGRSVRVPLTPGEFATVSVSNIRPLAENEMVELHGPGVLAFDGERDVALGPDCVVRARVTSDGPLFIDIARTLAAAALADHFTVVPDAFSSSADPSSKGL